MRFIPTRIHGIIDYAFGVILLAAPYLLGFADGTAAQYVAQAIGAGAIVYAALTDYELGLVPLLSMPVHLGIDILGGLVLGSSPFLFGFADRVLWPHVVCGVTAIVAGLTTRTVPTRGVNGRPVRVGM